VVTVPAGATTGTVSVPTTEDTIDEIDEDFTIATGSASATGTILDDDATPSITAIADASAEEGENVVFNFTISNPSSVAVDYIFTLTNGTAGDLGYTTTDVVVTVPAGATTGTVSVPTTEDTIDEAEESFNIIFDSLTAVGTILDDDISNDAVGTDEEDSVVIAILDNDVFNKNNGITVSNVETPLNGTVVLNADNTITYTPYPDFNGIETFYYTVTVINNEGVETTRTAEIVIVVNPVVDVVDDSGVTDMDQAIEIDVLENDTFEGTNHEVTSTTIPSNGVVTINSDGTVTYTPNNGFVGFDSFNYEVTVINADGTTTTEVAFVEIEVLTILDALDDYIEVENQEPVVISIYDNDFNIPTAGLLTISTQAENGIVTIDDNGTPNDPSDDIVTYNPNTDFIGDDVFFYTICDAYGNCDTAKVLIVAVGVLADCVIDFPGSPNSSYEGYGFSPNGDGFNDEFEIEFIEICYPNYNIQIFNRWGNTVFEYTHDGNESNKPIWWDGKSNGRMTINKGKVLPAGTYFYIIYLNKENLKPVSGYIYLTK